MTRRKGEIDRSFFDDMLGQVEEASSPVQSSDVALKLIVPRTDQFRRTFHQESIDALAASINELGLLEPIVVREQGNGFEIVAGERRYRALRQLAWERAPVRIVAFNDAQAELAGAVENLNREDLSPLEEVDAVLSVLQHTLARPRDEVVTVVTRVRSLELEAADMSEGDAQVVTELFKRLGYSSVNSFYANRLSLLRLPEDILQAMRDDSLEYTKARVLARVKDEARRRELLVTTLQDGLSVEELEKQVGDIITRSYVSPKLYEDAGRLKRRITRRWVQNLNTKKQKRLSQLLKEFEKLFEDQG